MEEKHNPSELDQLAKAFMAGDHSGTEILMKELYPAMRQKIHQIYSRNNQKKFTKQPTEVAHDALVKLLEKKNIKVENYGELLAIAHTILRRSLVDYIRSRSALKRGGGQMPQPLDDQGQFDGIPFQDKFLAYGVALQMIGKKNPKAAAILDLKYVGRYTDQEIAELLQLSIYKTRRLLREYMALLRHEFEVNDPRDGAAEELCSDDAADEASDLGKPPEPDAAVASQSTRPFGPNTSSLKMMDHARET